MHNLPNRATGVYYVALFEIGLPRRGMFCIMLVYTVARAGAEAAPLHVNVALCGITYFELNAFSSYRLIRSHTEIPVGIDHLRALK